MRIYETRFMHRFYFKLGNRIVLVGISSNPWIYGLECIKVPGWEDGHIALVGDFITVKEARAWLEEQKIKRAYLQDPKWWASWEDKYKQDKKRRANKPQRPDAHPITTVRG